jgi:hypothetical protein
VHGSGFDSATLWRLKRKTVFRYSKKRIGDRRSILLSVALWVMAKDTETMLVQEGYTSSSRMEITFCIKTKFGVRISAYKLRS